MKSYSYEDILKALEELGIGEGDSLYVSTNLGVVGKPPETVKSIKDLCSLFYDAILERIGKSGSLYVPCFSYTFGKSSASSPAVFDPNTTKPEIGSFPNFIHSLPNRKRTIDPMLSVCLVGEGKDFLNTHAQCSYCEGSFLSKLAKSDIKLLNIGIGPDWVPFIHYVDWLLASEHRYGKVFNGVFVYENTRLSMPWLYHVRALIRNCEPEDAIGKEALEIGIYKRAPLGSIYLYSCVAREYFEFVLKKARENPWILAKGPPTNVLLEEKARTGIEVYKKTKIESEEELIKEAVNLSRDVVSDSMDVFMEYLQEFYGLKDAEVYSWKSGESLGAYIVPERWLLREFYLEGDGKVFFSNGGSHNRIFRYSIAMNDFVEEEQLFRHLHISVQGLRCVSTWNNRDWGFVLNSEEYTRLKGVERFKVYINADFSLGELRAIRKTFSLKEAYKTLVIVAFTEGPYKVDENLSGVLTAGKLIKEISEGRLKPKYNLHIVFVPHVMALWGLLMKSELKPDAVIFLKYLGNKENACLITNNRKIINIPSYLMPTEFFLGVGNHPTLATIEYPRVNMLMLLRGKLPFSHAFPQPYHELDTDRSIDIKSLQESYNFLKHLITEAELGDR